jgi:hypothetical protein
LVTAVARLAQDWAEYTPAIRRWERVTKQDAPLPTELGPRGGRRLAADFVEWLMGLPRFWVTGVRGLNRTEQLRALGNAVVPLQAFTAYRYLLTREIEH